MKTLLLSAPIYNKAKYGRRFFAPYAPPIGLAYIASTLRREGYEARVVDTIGRGWEDIEALIRYEMPDIVGINCFTEQRQAAFILADTVKSVNKNIKVAIGGVHASFMHEQILKNFLSVDIVVIGEGEITFLELVRALHGGGKLSRVKGITYREKDEIIKTEERPLISDLDSLPFPDFDDFAKTSYGVYSPIRAFNIRDKNGNLAKHMSINTSRGCFAKCQFCSVHRFWRSCWRARSPANVADEIEKLSREKGVGFINFADDIFTVKEERVVTICKEILKRDIRIAWDCETRADFISRDMLHWMKRSGCVSIAFGIESGSPFILNSIDKKISVDKIEEAVYLTKSEGIKVSLLLMVGNPGESEETINESISLVEKLKPDIRAVQIASVYPGAPLYDLYKSTGSINDDYWLTDKPAPFFIQDGRASLRQLKIWQDRLLIGSSPNNLEKALRELQSFIDRTIGVRLTSQGIK